MSAFTVTMTCPGCPDEIGVPVDVNVARLSPGEPGTAYCTFDPDTANLWAHVRTHATV